MAGPCVRTVYLITYSQAGEEWTRESFSAAVLDAFENNESTVRQWVCSKEAHQDGGFTFILLSNSIAKGAGYQSPGTTGST